MPTGPELLDAIKNNPSLAKIDNCPGVPARLGYAVYGSWQDDDQETVILGADKESMAETIKALLDIPNSVSIAHAAVWHFCVESPVHHFAVIPWYRLNAEVGWVFTVFMAYENHNVLNKYTLGEYINGGGNTAKGKGYAEIWTWKELGNMLGELLLRKSVWPKYFGGVDNHAANKITCWKYPFTPLDQAIKKVSSFKMD